MKHEAAVSLLLVVLVLFCSSAMADNLVQNPGFESPVLDPWWVYCGEAGSGFWGVHRDEWHTGVQCALGGGWDDHSPCHLVQNLIPTDLDDIQEISFWAKSWQGPVTLYWGYLSQLDEGHMSGTFGMFELESYWTQKVVGSPWPPGEPIVGIAFACSRSGSGEGYVLIDDVVVERTTPVSAMTTTWGRVKQLYR